jgi:bifunctional non-homologous end joining protein LigD
VGKGSGRIRLSSEFDGDQEQIVAAVQAQGLEGIVAKRKGSAYEPGKRTGAWIKP